MSEDKPGNDPVVGEGENSSSPPQLRAGLTLSHFMSVESLREQSIMENYTELVLFCLCRQNIFMNDILL